MSRFLRELSHIERFNSEINCCIQGEEKRMLQTSKLKIVLRPVDDGGYFLTTINERNEFVESQTWKNWLFSRHDESYYGSVVPQTIFKKVDGVHVDGWQLVTLFANEQFSQFVHWDWCEYAETCLAAATIIQETILQKQWLPDFTFLEKGEFRWSLPRQVKEEFTATFWDESLTEHIFDDDQPQSILLFVQELFHQALQAFIQGDHREVERMNGKLATLLHSEIDFSQLASYFDAQSWLEWAGLVEDTTPFSIGLQLEEPEEDEESWLLTPFLRKKAEPDQIIEWHGAAKLPKEWERYRARAEQEIRRWQQLLPFLKNQVISEEEAWLFLTDGSETLLALGVEILLPSWWQAIKDAQLKIKAQVKGSVSHRPSFVGLDSLLNFDWRFSMNGVDLSEEEFRQLVEEKRKLVFIRGRWVNLDPKMMKQIQAILKKADEEGLHIRDLLEQELIREDESEEIEDLENPHYFARIQIELNRQWKQMIQQLTDLQHIPEFPLSESLHGELRPYQKQGMDWLLFLRQHGFGACLADDMGLGKTIQLIAYLLAIKEQGELGTSLIICPTSVLGNWQKELERFAPSLSVHLHYGPNRSKDEQFTEHVNEVDVVLTSYALAHLDEEQLAPIKWNTIAIDEAQNIKNSQTKQSRAVRKLTGKQHIALTGTPMENRLSELWSIFDFINRGYLGSLGQFQKRFIIPIEKNNDEKKIHQLQALIRPFLLRRTKKDENIALNLPDKLEQKEYCPLTSEQASLYEQLISDTFAEIEQLAGFQRKGLILQMLSRLKQLCNHPALYLKEQQPHQLVSRSAKLEKLVELVEAVLDRGESCLIFTQYIRMGEFIQEMLNKTFGVDVPFLNGSVSKANRDQMIHQFQQNKFPILLLSLKAGGTGLNLTAANHVVHYDRWWNPAVENQATDRAYRIGQTRFVHVHKLICTGTLEEKIDAMLEKKQALNEEIIQSESWITELETDELHDLLRLD